MTKESSPTLIRWKNWLTAGTGIGIYPHTGDPTWFKPSDGCKMQLLGVPYCAVCSEAIVERIHDLVKPIVAYSPHAISVDVTAPVTFALDTVLRPDPNTLRITWSVDGVVKQQQGTTFLATPTLLGLGTHSLVAAVVDTGALVRADRHFTAHEYSVTWNVTVSASTVIESRTNDLRLDVYPNPASSALHVAVESERAEPISVQIIAENGEVLAAFATTSTSHYSHTFDLQALPHGSYAVLLSTPDGILRRGFVRN